MDLVFSLNERERYPQFCEILRFDENWTFPPIAKDVAPTEDNERGNFNNFLLLQFLVVVGCSCGWLLCLSLCCHYLVSLLSRIVIIVLFWLLSRGAVVVLCIYPHLLSPVVIIPSCYCCHPQLSLLLSRVAAVPCCCCSSYPVLQLLSWSCRCF